MIRSDSYSSNNPFGDLELSESYDYSNYMIGPKDIIRKRVK